MNKENIQTGQEIPGLSKTAFMPIEEDARNPIHTEDYAQSHGMRGRLLPVPPCSVTCWKCFITPLEKSGSATGRSISPLSAEGP